MWPCRKWRRWKPSKAKPKNAAEPLPNVSPLDKIIVAFAGPLFSFALAFVFAFIVWGVGKPSNEGDNSTMHWLGCDPNGPAWQAGLRPGDTILEVDGHPVKHFAADRFAARQRQMAHCHQHRHEHCDQISARRQGRRRPILVPTHRATKWYERKSLRQILIAAASKATIL